MKLSDFFLSGGLISKSAVLLKAIKLDNGTTLKKGTKGTILKNYGDGTFHFDTNSVSCRVKKTEVKVEEGL